MFAAARNNSLSTFRLNKKHDDGSDLAGHNVPLEPVALRRCMTPGRKPHHLFEQIQVCGAVPRSAKPMNGQTHPIYNTDSRQHLLPVWCFLVQSWKDSILGNALWLLGIILLESSLDEYPNLHITHCASSLFNELFGFLLSIELCFRGVFWSL